MDTHPCTAMKTRPATHPATARADIFRFLSACFYEPCPAFTEEKLFESMAQAAEAVDPVLAADVHRLGEAFVACDLQSLLVDYTRLFLGPMRALASPYGSAWLQKTDELVQASTLAVQALYREGGFDIDDSMHEFPDHVAVELEFLYLLVLSERACPASDDAAAQRVRTMKRRLLDEHLGAWIDDFTNALRKGAETPFYRVLADVAQRAVDIARWVD